jgi:hypothetical protein
MGEVRDVLFWEKEEIVRIFTKKTVCRTGGWKSGLIFWVNTI